MRLVRCLCAKHLNFAGLTIGLMPSLDCFWAWTASVNSLSIRHNWKQAFIELMPCLYIHHDTILVENSTSPSHLRPRICPLWGSSLVHTWICGMLWLLSCQHICQATDTTPLLFQVLNGPCHRYQLTAVESRLKLWISSFTVYIQTERWLSKPLRLHQQNSYAFGDCF